MDAAGSQSVTAYRWRLVPRAVVHRTGPCTIDIEVPAGRLPLRFGNETLTDAVASLTHGARESELEDAAAEIPDGAARVQLQLLRLASAGLLELDVTIEGTMVATLLPRTRSFSIPDRPERPPRRVVLSRFAYLRRTDRGMLLAAPDAPAEALLADPRCIAWIGEAVCPVELGSGGDTGRVALIGLCYALGFLVDAEAQEPPAQQTWEFHDRLFQRAARSYADFAPRGGTYRFVGGLPPFPAVRPSYPGGSVPLPVPAAADRNATGLRDVMERRRSRRTMGSQHVSLLDVAELLYRVARITEIVPGGQHECLHRPYPSGGAVHELEFYLAIGACVGLSAGFYHYRGAEHALTRLEHGDLPAAAMLRDAAYSWAQPDQPPHALVVISTRLPRLAWKYQGIAYKISLLNAGVALQCLALVAEDIGLHAAASGSGNPELFAAATGVDSYEETSIAEFGFGLGPEEA